MSAMKATAGPFIVTHRANIGVDYDGKESWVVDSRRAFASLEDAREHAWTTIHQIDASRVSLSATRMKWAQLPETGGTVELPDGTVLEVEPTTIVALGRAAGLPGPTGGYDPSQPTSARTVLEAFNAKQAA